MRPAASALKRPVVWAATVVATLVVYVGFAPAAATAVDPPALQEPAPGTVVAHDASISFVITDPVVTPPTSAPPDPEQAPLWIIVSTSADVDGEGVLWRFGSTASANSFGDLSFEGGGRWRWARTTPFAPGTYFWQAYRRECAVSIVDCKLESEVRTFTVQTPPPPPPAPKGIKAAFSIEDCVQVVARSKSACRPQNIRRAAWRTPRQPPTVLLRVLLAVDCYAGYRPDGTVVANSYVVSVGSSRKRVCKVAPNSPDAYWDQGLGWNEFATLSIRVTVEKRMKKVFRYSVVANGVVSERGRFAVRTWNYRPDRSFLVYHWHGTDAYHNICIRQGRPVFSLGGRLYCTTFVERPASVLLHARILSS